MAQVKNLEITQGHTNRNSCPVGRLHLLVNLYGQHVSVRFVVQFVRHLCSVQIVRTPVVGEQFGCRPLVVFLSRCSFRFVLFSPGSSAVHRHLHAALRRVLTGLVPKTTQFPEVNTPYTASQTRTVLVTWTESKIRKTNRYFCTVMLRDIGHFFKVFLNNMSLIQSLKKKKLI